MLYLLSLISFVWSNTVDYTETFLEPILHGPFKRDIGNILTFPATDYLRGNAHEQRKSYYNPITM